jgi:hypothetical protein
MAFPEWIYGVILIIIGSLGNNLGNNLVSLGHKETGDKKKKNAAAAGINPGSVVPLDESAAEEANSPAGNKYSEIDINDENKTSDESKDEEGKEDGKEKGKEKEKKESDWRTIGTVIFVFGNLFTFASFGFGAQSLIAALESIQFVSNVFFVKYVHKLPITHRMSFSTCSIVAGNILVVIFASHAAGLIDSDAMIYLYKTNTAYHVYMVFAFFIWVGATYIFRTYYHSRVVLEEPLKWKHNFLEPFCYAVSSAILGTQAVLNSKCMSMLLQVTFRGGKNEFLDWFVYFLLVSWIVLVVFWLRRLDRGLLLYPPLFIIPIMQVFFVVFAILCGGIYFKEFDHFTPSQFVGFTCGVSMILGGVYGLAPPDMQLTVPHTHTDFAAVQGQPQQQQQQAAKETAAEQELDAPNHQFQLTPALAANGAATEVVPFESDIP